VGEIADRLDAMTIRVTSPDNNIAAKLWNRRQVDFRFRSGAYRSYDERGLEHQLSQLGTLLWTGYRRGYDTIMKDNDMILMVEPKDANSDTGRKFLEMRDVTVAEGVSQGGWVKVRTEAMLRWKFRIKDGGLAGHTEEQFITETLSAIHALMRHWEELVRRAREECFDPKRAKLRREGRL
jgi:hypothetical protein